MIFDAHTHQPKKNSVYCLPFNFEESDLGQVDFFCAGIHPWNTAKVPSLDQKLLDLREALNNKKCVAVGEIGLDRNFPDIAKQKEMMIAQLELAVEFDLPVVIHCVKALSDIFSILKSFPKKIKIYLHGINLNEQELTEVNKRKYFIGVGPQLFNKSKIQRLISLIPKDKILIETDDTDLPINRVFDSLSLHVNHGPEDLVERLNSNFFNFYSIDNH